LAGRRKEKKTQEHHPFHTMLRSLLSLVVMLRALLLLHAFPQHVHAQSSSTTSTAAAAPSGDYTGFWRPQVHFSPPSGFMNDPNGLFFDDTEAVWHLYYQYNPSGLEAGNQHWGHATSPDLYHWTNQPIAIYPLNSSALIFTGSVVVDVNNTSGLFPAQSNGVVAIFTLATPDIQEQALAYSCDGGYTFQMYAGNPVIASTSNEFRDPKVLWYQDHWVMVVAFSQAFTIAVYTSPDLISWSHASNFTHHGLLGRQYECPNLVQLPVQHPVTAGPTNTTMWLLLVSINPGSPLLGGSATQYFPGAFNGTHFTAVDAAARLADFGPDNYAAQFFANVPASPPAAAVSLAWASNWLYTSRAPTGPTENWRSAMTLPRRNALRNLPGGLGWQLVSAPYADLAPVLAAAPPLANTSIAGNGSVVVDTSRVRSAAVYFSARVRGIPLAGAAGSLNVTFASAVSGEFLTAGFFIGNGQPAFFVSRAGVRGFGADDVFWGTKFGGTSVVLPDASHDGANAASGTWDVQGVLDRSLFEIFLNDGSQSGTFDVFPEERLSVLTIATAGIPDVVVGGNRTATVTEVRVWGLESVWDGGADVAVGGKSRRDGREL